MVFTGAEVLNIVLDFVTGVTCIVFGILLLIVTLLLIKENKRNELAIKAENERHEKALHEENERHEMVLLAVVSEMQAIAENVKK